MFNVIRYAKGYGEGEVVDCFDTQEEAEAMAREYRMSDQAAEYNVAAKSDIKAFAARARAAAEYWEEMAN